MNEAAAIQCYNCENCNDPFISTGIPKLNNCGACLVSKFENKQFKTFAIILIFFLISFLQKAKEKKLNIVVRQCVDFCPSGDFGGLKFSCCSTDLCNSSPSQFKSKIGIFSLFSGVILSLLVYIGN